MDGGKLRRRERLREDFRHGAFMVRKRLWKCNGKEDQGRRQRIEERRSTSVQF